MRAAEAVQTLTDSSIRAPFGGVIAERFVHVGDYVHADTRVVTLLVDDPLRLELTVPEANVGSVHPGLAVSFETVAVPGRVFTATREVHGRRDPRSHAGPRRRGRSPTTAIMRSLPGMFVTAQLPIGEVTSPVVPAKALVHHDENDSVFVVVDGHLVERVVQLGPKSGGPRGGRRRREEGRAGGRLPPSRRGRRHANRVAEKRATRSMQWLASLCIRQPVLTWVLMLVFIVIGVFGYFSLGVDQFPKIDFPAIVVTTTENGAAPEEIETELTDKIEGAVNTISGIDELRSTSSQGVSLVIITFSLDKDPDVAAQEVRDHINNVLPDLPKGIDQPVVSKVDPDASPILYVTLSSPGSIRDTTELADKRVRRQIESINGVGQVNILGGKKRQINVWLDPLKLAGRRAHRGRRGASRSRSRT